MCGRILIREDGSPYGETCFTFPCKQEWNVHEACSRFLTWDGIDGASWDKLIPRKLIGNLRYPLGYICEDIPFIFTIIERCDKVIHIGEPLYFYRQRENSTSHNIGFNERSIGLVKYNREILEHIELSDRTLLPQAQYFYLHMALYFHHLLQSNGVHGVVYRKNRKNIIKHSKDVLQNPYFEDYEKREINIISKCYYPFYIMLRHLLKK